MKVEMTEMTEIMKVEMEMRDRDGDKGGGDGGGDGYERDDR